METATHIGRLSERLELLLFERESAEGQRRILVVFQLSVNLLNLLITLGLRRDEGGGERECVGGVKDGAMNEEQFSHEGDRKS